MGNFPFITVGGIAWNYNLSYDEILESDFECH